MENEGKKEYKKLYYKDVTARELNKDCLLRMLILNHTYSFIPFAEFYKKAEI